MLPAIYIIGCGGTIAGRAASQSELIGYQAGEVSIDDLIQSVPEMTSYASIRGEQFCNIDSSSMTEELLLPLNGAILLGEILACIVCAILEYLLTNGRRNDV